MSLTYSELEKRLETAEQLLNEAKTLIQNETELGDDNWIVHEIRDFLENA